MSLLYQWSNLIDLSCIDPSAILTVVFIGDSSNIKELGYSKNAFLCLYVIRFMFLMILLLVSACNVLPDQQSTWVGDLR